MGTSMTWYQNENFRGVTFLRCWWQLGIKQEVVKAVALRTAHGNTRPWIPTLLHENVYRSAWLQYVTDYIAAPRWWWQVTMAQPDNGCSFLISEQDTTWMHLTDDLGCTLKTCTQVQWQRSNQPSFLSSPLSHNKIMGQHFGDRKEFNTYWAINYSWSTIMYCLCIQLEEPRKTMEISSSILDMIAGYFSNANQLLNTLLNLVSAAGSLSWQEFWIIMDFEIEFCVKRTRTELLHLDLGCG